MEKFVKCFTDLLAVTNIPKYRSFQYRLLHRAIVTNVQLHYYKLTNSDQCSFCHMQRETYSHLFIQCKKVIEL